jgi:lysyl-tRNA synthetase, class II
MQVMLSLESVGEQALDAWKPTSTSATTSASPGEVITSRRGELSVLATRGSC